MSPAAIFHPCYPNQSEMRKMSAHRVPQQLIEIHLNQCHTAALGFQTEFNTGGNASLDCIEAGNETWIYYCTPQSKWESMSWKRADKKHHKNLEKCRQQEWLRLLVLGTGLELFYSSHTYHRARRLLLHCISNIFLPTTGHQTKATWKTVTKYPPHAWQCATTYSCLTKALLLHLKKGVKNFIDMYRQDRRKVTDSERNGKNADNKYIPKLARYLTADTFLKPVIQIWDTTETIQWKRPIP